MWLLAKYDWKSHDYVYGNREYKDTLQNKVLMFQEISIYIYLFKYINIKKYIYIYIYKWKQ